MLKKSKHYQCLECGKKAIWIRCTQFSGSHPYCLKCAKLEKDFKKDGGSYYFWTKINGMVAEKD